jgi:hypothetical protein
VSYAPDRLSAALSDRYRIERELGQGGMAAVYLAGNLRWQDRRFAVPIPSGPGVVARRVALVTTVVLNRCAAVWRGAVR